MHIKFLLGSPRGGGGGLNPLNPPPPPPRSATGGGKTAIFAHKMPLYRGTGYIGGMHIPIPYSSFLRSTGGMAPMAPPPCAPLSYASEQHATEDLKKKGREKNMHAHHVGYSHVRPEAARSIQY